MHAWLCENPVGVDALTWKELPTPQPGAGEVLIEIQAASLNFPDLLIVQNKYQMKPPLPFVPGSEYAGVVRAVGEGVKHLQVGQTVACLSGTGGFGTHTLAPAKLCMPLPDGFPAVDAAAFIMTYATSHHALIDRGQLQAGETVLILGAAGGVGTAAIQIAKAHGAKVIAAASTAEKCALCLEQGAIRRHTERLSQLLDAARSRSVKLALAQGCQFVAPPQGLFGWVDVGVDTDVLALRMHDAGYLLAPGSLFHADRRPGSFMRVNFASTQDDKFWLALARTREALL